MEDFDPKYTEKCSKITVFSLEKGFFSEFHESVKESCGDDWIERNFAKISGGKEKLRELLEHDASAGPILGTLEHVTPIFKGKDFSKALKKRFEGDRKLQEGNFQSARILLSQAIIKAPQGNAENERKFLAETIWKRSEALIGMEEGEKALQDMKYATEMGLQIKQSPEYFWRMAKCYILKYDLKARKNEQEQLKGPSEKLEITSTSSKGKFFIASRDINPGEDVICETPVAACLLPEFFGSHCLHCQVRLVAPIGCPECCSVAFCSQECQKVACSSYHRFECKYLDLLIGSGMSVLSFVALRLITESGTYEQAVESVKSILDTLCRHSEMRSGDDYLQRCLMSIFLLRILQKSGFFGRRTTESVEPTLKELHIAEIILHLLEALQFNAHEIYETLLGSQNSIVGSKVVYIGVAIYKKASLFNHDCFPAVARYFSGNKLRLTALRPIAAGNAVTENYGPVFTKQDGRQRQRNLRSRYWFHCECLSCRENWPKLEELSNKSRINCPSFKCEKFFSFPDHPEKKIKCSQCKSHISLLHNVTRVKEAEDLYRKGAEAMDV
uniref:Uncharacterized protein n=1 Tax=Phlebotomus papatasi TaxID=29031 RepID=A0A1B0CYM5_PHLPP